MQKGFAWFPFGSTANRVHRQDQRIGREALRAFVKIAPKTSRKATEICLLERGARVTDQSHVSHRAVPANDYEQPGPVTGRNKRSINACTLRRLCGRGVCPCRPRRARRFLRRQRRRQRARLLASREGRQGKGQSDTKGKQGLGAAHQGRGGRRKLKGTAPRVSFDACCLSETPSAIAHGTARERTPLIERLGRGARSPPRGPPRPEGRLSL